MPVVYHSDCCPLKTKALSQLILDAYRLYNDSKKKKQPIAHPLSDQRLRLARTLMAKVLPLGRTKIFGYVATRENEAYVIFRGTESVSEWVGDSRFLQVNFLKGWGKVHKGFREIYRTCSPGLLEAITGLGPEIDQITIAGHSLGAALATLATVEIMEQTRFKTPVLYTFASPRVGNLAFAKKFHEVLPQSYRILNTEDIVITEPKAAMVGKLCRYAHVGHPFAFSHYGGSIVENHLLESYMLHL